MDTVNPWRRKPNQENWANTKKFVRLKKNVFEDTHWESILCAWEYQYTTTDTKI